MNLFFSLIYYYKKNKKSSKIFFILAILILFVTNFLYQITKVPEYYIKFSLSNSVLQLYNEPKKYNFAKNFALYSSRKLLEKEKILYRVDIDTLVVEENYFFQLFNDNSHQDITNLNNIIDYNYTIKNLNRKFNLNIQNEIEMLLKIEKEKEIYYINNFNLNNDPDNFEFIQLNNLLKISDIANITIKKEYKNIISLQQIFLLNLFIFVLALFYPYLLVQFRKNIKL